MVVLEGAKFETWESVIALLVQLCQFFKEEEHLEFLEATKGESFGDMSLGVETILENCNFSYKVSVTDC